MSRHLVWLALAISVLFNLAFAAAWISARTAADLAPAATDAGAPADGATEGTRSGDGPADDDPDAGPGPGSGGDGPGAIGRVPGIAPSGRSSRGGPASGRGPDPMLRQVSRALDLDEDQEAYLGGLQTGMKSDEMLFDVAIGAVRERLIETYEANGASDPETVRELHEREAELLRQRRLARAERLEAFMTVLRPEQLERFRAMVEARTRGDRAGASERLAELDADGDGQLDEQEIEALRSRINRTIRERTERAIEQRRQLRERFDADGDGTLDRREREEARRWQMLQRYDADGDGELDAAEREALERDRESWRKRWRNGDRDGRDRRWRRDRADDRREDGRG